ncbi:DinB family protein [Nocardia sp. NPDC051570]|uniref:DinB family protein n=1 Tax=Nocardia sp. NPDC051570 TaxID=3364324 RepID=UPI003798A0B9
MTSIDTARTLTGERADILETLRAHRGFLRYTVRDLTDEQATRRTTVSELCLGGLIKHVTEGERGWIDFILSGPAALASGDKDFSEWTEEDFAVYANAFRMLPGETLVGLLAEYDRVAERTDELVASLPDLEISHPLPRAPWFEPGAVRSARRVLMHIIAETAQHAGHADILREALDGAKTMG